LAFTQVIEVLWQPMTNHAKNILIIGAGRSSSALIKYLSQHAAAHNWTVTVTDREKKFALERVEGLSRCVAEELDALDPAARREALKKADIVVSMLPARFHIEVVRDCIDLKKHIITPSYVTDEINGLDEEAKKAGIVILNEMGLDPGIDHMSAMKIIHHIQGRGGKLTSFKSFTGGLIAPESDDNPWNYKFTWNPRNVVLAGQGGAAEFIRKGKYKYIPYHRLFSRTEVMEIEGYGLFEGYANRNSLQYREVYGLEDIQTIYRGTLRRKGYSEAWDVFVQLGMTDDSYTLEDSMTMTYRQFINAYLTYDQVDTAEKKLCDYLGLDPNGEVLSKLTWLGLFSDDVIGLENATPAQILQKLLEGKWGLKPDDKDMIAMYHHFEYVLNGASHAITSHMISIGEDQTYTGMSRTVGLPIAIAVKRILQGSMNLTGVHLPTRAAIYEPILSELEEMGIVFVEKEV